MMLPPHPFRTAPPEPVPDPCTEFGDAMREFLCAELALERTRTRLLDATKARQLWDEGCVVDDPASRIKKALDFAVRFGGIDGSHHKDWVVDQMVRALTGCPMVTETTQDCRGNPHTFETQGESEEYKSLVKEACDGEDGPNTFNWEIGIAP